jgi:hypothetical protein
LWQINAEEKLDAAKKHVIEILSSDMLTLDFNPEQNQFKCVLRDGSRLYIVYNSGGEHAYQLLFSEDRLDRVRFDSMDVTWKVTSKPNHFHPRFAKEGFFSPMTGDPESDMPNLCNLIKNHRLLDKDHRF